MKARITGLNEVVLNDADGKPLTLVQCTGQPEDPQEVPRIGSLMWFVKAEHATGYSIGGNVEVSISHTTAKPAKA